MSLPLPTELERRLVRRPLAALVASWVAWAGLVWLVTDNDRWSDADTWAPVLVAGSLLVLISVGVVRAALRPPWTGIVAGLWTVAVALGMWAGAELVSTELPLLAVAVAAILLVTSLIPQRSILVLCAVGLAAGYLLAIDRSGIELGPVQRILHLALISISAWMGVRVVTLLRALTEYANARTDALVERQARLQEQQAEIARLYEISRSIGSGGNLSEVIPDMVGRIAATVGAGTGLILLYEPERQALEVVSPIWVAGRAVRSEGYALPLTGGGLIQRVFVGSEPEVRNDLTGVDDPLLADIAAEQVAAVPLRIEARNVGVLLIADKQPGFTQEDMSVLESLATPAAMVVDHLTRFKQAQDHGERMSELAQLKTDFVSVVSHELRTPLTSIIGSLATLSRPELAPEDPGSRQLLTSARRQADRLKRLIEDLLTVSRLDNRSLPMRPEKLDLNDLVTDVVRTLAVPTGLISIDTADTVPNIETDPEHVRRVLVNLVDNAVKYGQGSAVTVRVRRYGEEVWVSVIDGGPGIPYELHDHVFERFTQVASHETRVKGGTGLGLSIVRGLAEALGGRVWFEPTVGGGATFTVALPLEMPSIRPG